jgi:hypothetical protein
MVFNQGLAATYGSRWAISLPRGGFGAFVPLLGGSNLRGVDATALAMQRPEKSANQRSPEHH